MKITEKHIQLLESLIYQTVQYGKLAGSKYFAHLDMDKYREYIYDVYSAETIWFDLTKEDIREQIGRNDEEGKDYGRLNKYQTDEKGQGKVRDFTQWVKMETGEIATNGLLGFIKNLDKLGNVVSGWMRNLKIKWKLRNVNPEYINQKYKELKANIARRDELRGSMGPKIVQVYGPDMPLLEKRLEGFVNICDTIHNLAENSDEQAFDSDKMWDSFAQQSNRALRAVPPKEGMFFRELQRIQPYVHHFDCTKSEWNDSNRLESLAKRIADVKESVITKIQDDIKFIKKITDGLRSQVSHIKIKDDDVGGAAVDNVSRTAGNNNTGERSVGPWSAAKGIDNDKLNEVVVEYARGYVASKFVLQLQDMFASEVLYLIEDIPKLFTPPKDKDRDERIRSKAQNQRDVAEIEEKQKKEAEQKEQQTSEKNQEKENNIKENNNVDA